MREETEASNSTQTSRTENRGDVREIQTDTQVNKVRERQRHPRNTHRLDKASSPILSHDVTTTSTTTSAAITTCITTLPSRTPPSSPLPSVSAPLHHRRPRSRVREAQPVLYIILCIKACSRFFMDHNPAIHRLYIPHHCILFSVFIFLPSAVNIVRVKYSSQRGFKRGRCGVFAGVYEGREDLAQVS